MRACVNCHTPLPVDGRFCAHCGTPSELGHVCPPDPIAELQERLARTLAGRYEITRLLGRGGMAVVFLAEDLVLERRVAIKVLPPDMSHDTKLIPRFQQEAKTAAKLDHPNIIPIYRVESEAGLDYFVMKYVTGDSLEQILDQGPLPIDLARRVLREAALALGHAHKRGIVHRDVKPANIMLESDGRLILTDFGISKALEGGSGFTGTGTIIGTPHYMAPEQAKGLEVDGRADQYALAIVGHQILTGKKPFDGSAHSILYKHVFEPPPPMVATRPDVPGDISAALERALSKDPEQRFPTMEDFAVALSGERSGARTVVSAAVRSQNANGRRTGALTGRSRVALRRSLMAFAVCAVIGGGVWGTLREAEMPPKSPPTVAPEIIVEPPPRQSVEPPPAVETPPASVRPAEPVVPEPKQQPAVRATSKPVVLMKNAHLTVDSDPWGMLYLDNVEVGPTPVTDYPLQPGKYRLRIEQEGYRDKIELIVVTGPNPIRRRYSLEPAGP